MAERESEADRRDRPRDPDPDRPEESAQLESGRFRKNREGEVSSSPIVALFGTASRRGEKRVPYDDGEPDDDGPGPAAA